MKHKEKKIKKESSKGLAAFIELEESLGNQFPTYTYSLFKDHCPNPGKHLIAIHFTFRATYYQCSDCRFIFTWPRLRVGMGGEG